MTREEWMVVFAILQPVIVLSGFYALERSLKFFHQERSMALGRIIRQLEEITGELRAINRKP